MDVVDDDGTSLVGTGEVGELVCRAPFPGMTRGFWRDPDKFIETYWSRASRRVGARRLGVRRRGRLLVPARPLRRHDEHRRQAHRPRRARVGRGRSSRRARGGCDRRAARGEGRDGVDLLLPAAGRRGDAKREVGRARRRRARQGVQARPRVLRRRAAEDAVGEDRAPRGEGDGARRPIPATCRRSRTPSPSTRSEQPLPDGVALITGGGRGIGASIARVARRRRLVGRRRPRGRATRSTRSRRRPAAAQCRWTSPRARRSSRRSARSATSTCSSRTPALAMGRPTSGGTFEVNVLGVHLCCEAALAARRARGS